MTKKNLLKCLTLSAMLAVGISATTSCSILPQGDAGVDGKTPYIGENGNWWLGETDTGVSAQGTNGEQGEKGDKGDTGEQGPKGEKGDTGDTGAKGDKGYKGDAGEDGVDGDTPYIGENGNWWIGTGDDAYDTGIASKEDSYINVINLFDVYDNANMSKVTVTLDKIQVKPGETFTVTFTNPLDTDHEMLTAININDVWYSLSNEGQQKPWEMKFSFTATQEFLQRGNGSIQLKAARFTSSEDYCVSLLVEAFNEHYKNDTFVALINEDIDFDVKSVSELSFQEVNNSKYGNHSYNKENGYSDFYDTTLRNMAASTILDFVTVTLKSTTVSATEKVAKTDDLIDTMLHDCDVRYGTIPSNKIDLSISLLEEAKLTAYNQVKSDLYSNEVSEYNAKNAYPYYNTEVEYYNYDWCETEYAPLRSNYQTEQDVEYLLNNAKEIIDSKEQLDTICWTIYKKDGKDADRTESSFYVSERLRNELYLSINTLYQKVTSKDPDFQKDLIPGNGYVTGRYKIDQVAGYDPLIDERIDEDGAEKQTTEYNLSIKTMQNKYLNSEDAPKLPYDIATSLLKEYATTTFTSSNEVKAIVEEQEDASVEGSLAGSIDAIREYVADKVLDEYIAEIDTAYLGDEDGVKTLSEQAAVVTKASVTSRVKDWLDKVDSNGNYVNRTSFICDYFTTFGKEVLEADDIDEDDYESIAYVWYSQTYTGQKYAGLVGCIEDSLTDKNQYNWITDSFVQYRLDKAKEEDLAMVTARINEIYANDPVYAQFEELECLDKVGLFDEEGNIVANISMDNFLWKYDSLAKDYIRNDNSIKAVISEFNLILAHCTDISVITMNEVKAYGCEFAYYYVDRAHANACNTYFREFENSDLLSNMGEYVVVGDVKEFKTYFGKSGVTKRYDNESTTYTTWSSASYVYDYFMGRRDLANTITGINQILKNILGGIKDAFDAIEKDLAGLVAVGNDQQRELEGLCRYVVEFNDKIQTEEGYKEFLERLANLKENLTDGSTLPEATEEQGTPLPVTPD